MTEENAGQPATPVSKDELTALIEQEWQTLQATVAGASEVDLLHPGPEVWSPKDHLAHLAAWLDVLQKHYLGSQSFNEAAGIDPCAASDGNAMDDVNAIFFERNQNQTLPRVRAWLEKAHAGTLARLDEMAFSDLMKVFDPDDPEARTVIQEVMSNTNEHYQEHNRIIKDLLGRSG